MAGLLEARDLTGLLPSIPASVRLAPDAASVADLLHDESQMAAAGVASVAEPTTLDELRTVLRWHAVRSHRVTVSGARTGVAGGAVPDPSTHLVSVARLRGVALDLHATQASVRVLAGTTLRELQAELAARAPGWALPLDPTETGASAGGMVATNAAGSRAFRFGATRDWVVGLTVELSSGRTLALQRGIDRAIGHTLTLVDGTVPRTVHLPSIPKPRTKNAVGYGFAAGGDVVDLFIGSEGTLGVVSEVTFRLMPSAESRLAFLQCLASPDQAFALVEALRSDAALRTTALEFLDPRSHELARETGKPEVARVLAHAPAGSCSVFAEFGYDDEAGLEMTIERVVAHVAAVHGDEAAGLAGVDDQVLRDIRAFRHAVPERINATIARRRERHPALHKVATDMAVEDQNLRWVYELYSTRLSAAGLDHAIFGHVGNNHFHVNILPKDEAELQKAKAIYAEFARELVVRGGCVSAEHGIGRLKKPFLAVQYDTSTLDAMRAAKRWLDPDWRLNPGVLIDP
ncbi:MAG TPA: FAD-binding oxidoreductase [Vicinamibacterales bacterium]|nr:FAD-binding oxidoreductase [Vicinamibacterales bacterium]